MAYRYDEAGTSTRVTPHKRPHDEFLDWNYNVLDLSAAQSDVGPYRTFEDSQFRQNNFLEASEDAYPFSPGPDLSAWDFSNGLPPVLQTSALPEAIDETPSSSEQSTAQWFSQPGIELENDQECNVPETVCFGTLCNVAFRVCDKPMFMLNELSMHTNQDGSTYPALPLQMYEDMGELLAADGRPLGMLDMKLFRVLKEILAEASFAIDAVIPSALLSDIVDDTGTFQARKVAQVELNFYGEWHVSQIVAAMLSRSGLFLQDPQCLPFDKVYRNPQYLDLPELSESPLTDSMRNVGTTNALSSQEGDASFVEADEQTNVNEDGYFDRLLNRFALDQHLEQSDVSDLIKTELQVHQRQALDFVYQQEASSEHQNCGLLWKPETGENGDVIYRHQMTGATNALPESTKGGILADEMGLGKTLVMICAIAGSLKAAFEYARSLTTPGDGQSDVLAAKSTLVVVPSSLLMETWIEEVAKHTHHGKLTWRRYHGQNRHTSPSALLHNDVVITTYGTVAADFKRPKSLLRRTCWYRIVLDEAHMIRNSSTRQFRAVSSLRSYIKWCLSGTPIQNGLDDLSSLVRYLQVPYLNEVAQFRRHISRPTLQAKPNQRPDFQNLRMLLQSICLRRTTATVHIADSTNVDVSVAFSPDERQQYRELGESWREAIEAAVSGHLTKRSHQAVLESLLRMRMFCNHGSVFASKDLASDLREPDEIGSIVLQQGKTTCSYCACDVLTFDRGSDLGSAFVTTCQRIVCGECKSQYDEASVGSCAICKVPHEYTALNPNTSALGSAQQVDLSKMRCPSKMQALLKDLDEYSECKSIVFSFWKKSLDVVEAMLRREKVAFLRVDGSLSTPQRKQVLKQYQDAPGGTILLMTLGTGAVGLNDLSVASRVHLLEPQWNPSVERQAIGRVVRMGQRHTVTVLRYFVENTVEEAVRDGQLRKVSLADGGFGTGSAHSLKQRAQKLKEMICPRGEERLG